MFRFTKKPVIQRTAKRTGRCGIAATEFALVLPPILLLIVGAMEVSQVFATQHKLQEASMTGCRIYMLNEKTKQDATNMIDMALAASNVTNYTITYSPATKSEITADMQPVKVTITVPYDSVSIGFAWFMSGINISSESTLPADLQGNSTLN